MLKSFSFAGQGIRSAITSEPNMRIHLAAAVIVVLAGFYLELSNTEWCLVILAIGLVLTAELFNSSLEELVDLLQPAQQPLAGKIKDMAAGAVLIAAISAACIGLLVFGKYLPI